MFGLYLSHPQECVNRNSILAHILGRNSKEDFITKQATSDPIASVNLSKPSGTVPLALSFKISTLFPQNNYIFWTCPRQNIAPYNP
jgi:hypothetical protein